jgi:hypothetical protein
MGEISRLREAPVASQEGMCYMGLVIQYQYELTKYISHAEGNNFLHIFCSESFEGAVWYT